MSTPSKGAIQAAGNIQRAQDSKGLPTEDWGRIIDNHTNAIADELAEALRMAIPFIEFADNEGRSPDDYPEVVKMINAQRSDAESALARYQQIKAKETP